MELAKGIYAHDLVLHVKKANVVVIADLHLGYEESLKYQGVLVPRFLCKELMKRLLPILERIKPEKIVINGDFKHEFGKVMQQEWRDTLRFIDFLGKHCKEIIIIRGNHDIFLGSIASRRNVKVEKELLIDNILIAHGDELTLNSKPHTVIIGHEHPAITLRAGVRAEKFKCYLVGKWKKSQLIVQPSCNFATEGTDILREKLLSPFLHQDISDFRIFVVGKEEVLNFGKVILLQEN